MKMPNRFLPLLPFVAACFLHAGSLTARAEEEKRDAGPPPAAEETQAVEALSKRGARADPLANGVNWRYVNFRGAEKPDAALYAQLKAIPSIVELSLAGMQFTPTDLANIAALKNLATLNLSKTNVTDEGLAAVENLEKLHSLNLFSTGITDAGLEHLAHLKNLRRLYLAETKVSDAGVAEVLKKALPEAQINRRTPEFAPAAPLPPLPHPSRRKKNRRHPLRNPKKRSSNPSSSPNLRKRRNPSPLQFPNRRKKSRRLRLRNRKTRSRSSERMKDECESMKKNGRTHFRGESSMILQLAGLRMGGKNEYAHSHEPAATASG